MSRALKTVACLVDPPEAKPSQARPKYPLRRSYFCSATSPTPQGCPSTLISHEGEEMGAQVSLFCSCRFKMSWHFWLLKNIAGFYIPWSSKTLRSLSPDSGGERMG